LTVANHKQQDVSARIVRFGQREVVLRTVDGRPREPQQARRSTRALTVLGAGLVLMTSVLAPAAQGAATSNGRGGFGWVDLAVAVAVLAGIVLLGVYGDVVVGAVIFGAVALIEMGARLSMRAVRSVARPRRESTRPIAETRGVSVEGRSP